MIMTHNLWQEQLSSAFELASSCIYKGLYQSLPQEAEG
jgi:hypothetical protein